MRAKSTSIVLATLLIGTMLSVGVSSSYDSQENESSLTLPTLAITPILLTHTPTPTPIRTISTLQLETQVPTLTSTPTSTPLPTPTQTPSPTSTPTSTPSPTRNPVYSVLNGVVTIEMAYFVTAYDPSLCWKVPQYMIDEDFFAGHDPKTNCDEINPETIEEDWKWTGAGYYIPDNYGLMVSCPKYLALFDGKYVSLEVTVKGIGRRYCRDSGSAILIIGTQFHPELGVEVPYMNIDILWNFQIENNFPSWNTGLNFGTLQMTIEQFDEKRDLLGL